MIGTAAGWRTFYALLSLSMLMAQPVRAVRDVVQSYDTYGSWFIACDNGLTCVAKGFSGSRAGAEIVIERDAGRDGSILFSFRSDRRFALGQIAIDGKPADLREPVWAIETQDGITTASTTSLTATRRIVARFKGATRVTLGAGAEVPLDGFPQAVRRMDERQGRTGGTTAIGEHGRLSAARVPAPPRLPRVPVHPITAKLVPGEAGQLVAAVRDSQQAAFAKESCDATPTGEAAQAYALSRGRALVLIPCLQGAYQDTALGFIIARAGRFAKQLVLPIPYRTHDQIERDECSITTLSNVEFDAHNGMLSVTAKGRAGGECGVSGEWAWDGKTFALSQLSLQRSCGGIENDWPSLFRSVR